MKSFLDILKEKIIVFDGATGTHFQGQNLTSDDFGGEHLVSEELSVSSGAELLRNRLFGGSSAPDEQNQDMPKNE